MIIERIHSAVDRIRGKITRSSQDRLERVLDERLHRLISAGFTLKHGIITSTDGVKMHHTHGVEYILCEIFLNHDYEFFVNNECVVFDVGMNFGTTTLYFANKSNVRRVYSFEPFIPTYEEAVRNMQLNGSLKDKITTYPFGLGSKDEQIEVLYDKHVAGGMSTAIDRFDNSDPMLSPAWIYRKEKASLEKLELRNAFGALNPLVEKHTTETIVLKVDTEGAEYDILGALDEGGLLKKTDIVFLEYHFRSPQELENRLTNNGLVVFYKGEHKKGECTGLIHAVRIPSK